MGPPGIEIYKHQRKAVEELRTGSILNGGVGSGKSLTALLYYYTKECGGSLETLREQTPMTRPKDLYIITTAAKRDTLDWMREYYKLGLSDDRAGSVSGVMVITDSWNNIKKYERIKNAFFIFDEQRVIGNGAWVSSFLKIAKQNNWILLSATPGDTWMDYVPVFIANGFFKNRTEFVRRHVVFSRFSKFPKVERYLEEDRLRKMRDYITVEMRYRKISGRKLEDIRTEYDVDLYNKVYKDRWNPYSNVPIKNASDWCFNLRRVVNSDPDRMSKVRDILDKHKKVIIFYNYNYELSLLRELRHDDFFEDGFVIAEYNGQRHEPIPEEAPTWAYLVQYNAGAEGWNCVETNAMIFYSLSYSYRMMEQASGRIDRLNTPFANLFYYRLYTNSGIDRAILTALNNKRNFNENAFEKENNGL